VSCNIHIDIRGKTLNVFCVLSDNTREQSCHVILEKPKNANNISTGRKNKFSVFSRCETVILLIIGFFYFMANTAELLYHIIFSSHICRHINDNLTELLPMSKLLYIKKYYYFKHILFHIVTFK